MHPGFRLQVPVGIGSCDRNRHAFDARFVAGQEIQCFYLEFLVFRPPHIHPKEHLSPILRFRAAGAGMNRHNGIIGVQFSREEKLDAQCGEARFQLTQLTRQLGLQGRVAALVGKLQQRIQIAHFGLDVAPLLELPLDRRLFPAHHCSGAGIVPEVRLTHLRFEFL